MHKKRLGQYPALLRKQSFSVLPWILPMLQSQKFEEAVEEFERFMATSVEPITMP